MKGGRNDSYCRLKYLLRQRADTQTVRVLVTNRSVLGIDCNNWHLIDRSDMMPFGGSNPISEVDFVRLVDQLIAYEEGQITEDQEVEFFEHLVETGACWQLSGHYQRVAATLIEAGLIKPPELAEDSL